MAFSFKDILSSFKREGSEEVAKTVGIDAGSSSVKVVEVEATEKALVLQTYGELQLGPYANAPLGGTAKLDQDTRIEAIVDVTREAGVGAKKGVMVIPLSVSFMTVVPLAVGEEEDLESKIAVEARKYIPLPLSDVALDWTELATPQEGAESTALTEVMIAAIEHTTIKDYNETLDAIGMTSQPSEIEAFSLVRALNRNDDTTLAVIDLGANTAKLYIAQEGVVARIHRSPVGGVAITQRIAELQDVSFEEAENMKRAGNQDDATVRTIQNATAAVLEGPLQEFKRIIDQYEQRMGASIGRVALAGGVAASSSTLPLVQDMLSREVEIGNPFDKLAYPAFMEDTLKEIAPIFAVSVGAALRHFSS